MALGFRRSSAEGTTSGTTVTTANSVDSGDAFETAAGTRIYDITHAAIGSQSYKCSGASGATGILGWTGGTTKMASFRVYFRYGAAPGAACDVIQVRNTGNGGAVQMGTNGKLTLVNDAGTGVFTTTSALSVDTWYLLEVSWKAGTTTSDGEIHFRYSLAASPTTYIQTFDTTTTNEGTDNFGEVRFGKLTSIAFSWEAWFDAPAYQDGQTTFLGQYLGDPVLDYTTAYAYRINIAGSNGTHTLTQTAGTTVTSISGPTSDIFTIVLPSSFTDVLEFEMESVADGDPLITPFSVYPRGRRFVLTRDNGTWVL